MLDATPSENRRFLNRLELAGCRHSVFSDCIPYAIPSARWPRILAFIGRKLRWDPNVTAKRELRAHVGRRRYRSSWITSAWPVQDRCQARESLPTNRLLVTYLDRGLKGPGL
jgi:hypothetical protein